LRLGGQPLGEMMPISVNLKQSLLALDNPLLRLELVQDALDELGWLKYCPHRHTIRPYGATPLIPASASRRRHPDQKIWIRCTAG
jgi:hypothetical protein